MLFRSLTTRALEWHEGAAVCVVLAAAGYPASVRKGDAISGLTAANALEDVQVFQAGTALCEGQLVTAGGRVLGVVGRAADVPAAIERAYAGVAQIRFDGAQWRRDIGQKALRRLQSS